MTGELNRRPEDIVTFNLDAINMACVKILENYTPNTEVQKEVKEGIMDFVEYIFIGLGKDVVVGKNFEAWKKTAKEFDNEKD